MEKPKIYEIPKDIYLFENVPLVLHDMSTVYSLCTQNYYLHKYGCPNFGEKEGCPPNVLHISQQYDLDSINMLLLRFPFYSYISQKKEIHPDWSMRALCNQRHWQNHLKASLNKYWDNVEERYPDYKVIKNPEAQGVNVQETLKQLDIDLLWPKTDENNEILEIPDYMYHVYLLGKELE